MEDKKLLNKRKKRTVKVEECSLDLESFLRNKKRQRLSEVLLAKSTPDTKEDDTTIDSGDAILKEAVTKEQRELIKKKLIEKYFAELPENEATRKDIINYIKVMVKNV